MRWEIPRFCSVGAQKYTRYRVSAISRALEISRASLTRLRFGGGADSVEATSCVIVCAIYHK